MVKKNNLAHIIDFEIPAGRVLLEGAVVRYLRNKAGLTSKGLANLAGIGHGSLSNYEREEVAPTKKTAKAIADALGVNVKDIIAKWETVAPEKEDSAPEATKEPETTTAPVAISLFENGPDISTIGERVAMMDNRLALKRIEEYLDNRLSRFEDAGDGDFASGARFALEDTLEKVLELKGGD